MGKTQPGVNDLLTWCQNNGEWGQQLIAEWVGLEEWGDKIEMCEVSRCTHRRVWWQCSRNKEHGRWIAAIGNRTVRNTGCPICRNEKIALRRSTPKQNKSLEYWCRNSGELGQQLINEWAGIDEDGNNIEMNKATRTSHKKVWWKCSKNTEHKWLTTIHSRTIINSGCPYCNTNGTSYPEQLIYQALKCIYTECETRAKYFHNMYNSGLEYDIIIPTIKTFIEYSPSYTHWNKEERDIKKAKACIQNDIRLLYISDDYIYDTENKNYIDIEDNDIDMLNKVLELLGHSIEEIDLDSIKSKAYNYSHGDIPEDKQLLSMYPELAKEMHPELNSIDFSKITVSSAKKVYFRCTKCGYGGNGEWVSTPNRRTYKGYETGCPSCGWNWKEQAYKKKGTLEDRKLKNMYPELYIECNRELNTDTDSISYMAIKKIYWTCTKCGYGSLGEWEVSVGSRAKGTGCPSCGWNWKEQRYKKPNRYNLGVNTGKKEYSFWDNLARLGNME